MIGRMFHVKQLLLTEFLPVDETALRQFYSAAEVVGLSPTDSQLTALVRGAQWLSRASKASGLSQYATPAEALLRAMAPALAYFAANDSVLDGMLADLGCGNGAIGATIALFAADLKVHLVDRAKRAYTTSEVLVAKMGLTNATARHCALSQLGPCYDAAVFRALAPANQALPLAAGVVLSGGLVCAYHRRGDQGFACPTASLGVLGTQATLVPDLVLTCYRR